MGCGGCSKSRRRFKNKLRKIQQEIKEKKQGKIIEQKSPQNKPMSRAERIAARNKRIAARNKRIAERIKRKKALQNSK